MAPTHTRESSLSTPVKDIDASNNTEVLSPATELESPRKSPRVSRTSSFFSALDLSELIQSPGRASENRDWIDVQQVVSSCGIWIELDRRLLLG